MLARLLFNMCFVLWLEVEKNIPFLWNDDELNSPPTPTYVQRSLSQTTCHNVFARIEWMPSNCTNHMFLFAFTSK